MLLLQNLRVSAQLWLLLNLVVRDGPKASFHIPPDADRWYWLQTEKLPVFFKHRDNLFYPAWTTVVPTTILRLPYSLLEATLWTVLTYFEVGLSLNAGRCAGHASLCMSL